ncbi:cellulose-binding domain-containing protein, partial [Streptomyces sp. CRN 30]|uniref:cellulose-binding domain-containing protein n=1 Tax=Streptomyces sp. CRN 30 TaxID=3075613 RepID=UPI002A80D00D
TAPAAAPPPTGPEQPSAAGSASAPAASDTPRPSPSVHRSADPDPGPAAQGTVTTTAPPATATTAVAPTAAPPCRVHYRLDSQWPDGFQATVTFTTAEALDDWRVSWTFPDGQHVTQMWDATPSGSGAHVTATAASYNAAVPAGATVTFGFLGTWEKGRNGAPGSFTLNGAACAGGAG